jgi:tetratricopeptide (TPR) repeat protein
VKLNGTEIPAGTYELFSIPDPVEWTVIIHKDTSQWGAYKYDEKNDVARIKAKPVELATPVETFTIDINDIRNESATLNLIWEKTRVPVQLTVDVASSLVPQIEATVASGEKLPTGFYYNAAMFYYEKGLDLNKAKTWIEKATSVEKPAFYMVHLKAKILAKLGEKEKAIAAAKQSSELAAAFEGPQSPFLKMNQDLIESLN